MDCDQIGLKHQKRIEVVLTRCEQNEHVLHIKLSLLLNELRIIPGVRVEVLTEIEELYIQKGIDYCYFAYHHGFQDGRANK